MPYGEIRVDTITFTNGGVDTSITVSGLAASTTGNLTVTGTISGATVRATTVSGVTVTGTTVQGASGTFTSITGGVATITSGVFAAGSAAAPSISFSSDSNTGIYSPGADQVSISTGGTERFRIDNNGQLEAVSLGSAAAPTYSFTGDQNTGIYSPGADQVALSTNGTGRLFVDASGNINIGGSDVGALGSAGRRLAVGTASAGNNGAVTIFSSTSGVGYLAFGDGTAGSDSYRGLLEYDHTSDSLRTYTAGSQRMIVTSAGLVGIGTSGPSFPLHVVTSGNSGLAVYAGTAGGNQIYLGNTAGESVVGTLSNQNFGIIANGGQKVTVTTGGNVGIGTTAPASRLHATGVSDYIFLVDGTLCGNTIGVFADSTTIKLIAVNNARSAFAPLALDGSDTRFQVSGSERARLDSSGRLLVGTSSTSANTRLVVQGSSLGSGSPALQHLCFDGATPASGDGLGFLIFGDNSQSQGAWITARRDGGTWSGSSKPSRLEFSTCPDSGSSPVERMRITSAGDIVINDTSSGGYKFVVRADSSTGTNVHINDTRTGTSSSSLMNFTRNTALVGNISTTNTATAYNTSSDYRLKENVAAITDGITRLLKLKPSRFNFIADPSKTVDGFIAHEAQAVVPEAVNGEKDAVDDEGNPVYQGIDQSKLVPLLTAALQEAVARIEQLEAAVATLQAS